MCDEDLVMGIRDVCVVPIFACWLIALGTFDVGVFSSPYNFGTKFVANQWQMLHAA